MHFVQIIVFVKARNRYLIVNMKKRGSNQQSQFKSIHFLQSLSLGIYIIEENTDPGKKSIRGSWGISLLFLGDSKILG